MEFEKKERNYWLVLGILFVLLMLGQFVVPSLGDDKLYATEPLKLSWLVNRYTTWSSRIFIDGLSLFLARNQWLFSILNAGVAILLIDTFAKLTTGRNLRTLFLLIMFFLALPVTLFLSAGLVATSLNYLWPVTLAFYVISRMNAHLSPIKLGIYSALLLFATNQEQVCVAMIIFLIGKAIKELCESKNITISTVLFLLISMINLLIITLCPGNSKRTNWSIKKLFPDFSKYSIWDKGNLGVSNTSKMLLFQQNIFMIMFLVLLALVLLFTVKNWKVSVLSLVPLAIVLPVNVFFSTLTGYGYNVHTFSKYLLEKQSSPMLNKLLALVAKLLNHDVSLFWNVVFIIIFILVFISIYYIESNWNLVFYFLIGLASHAMMGFSPTIFKSGDRTAFILYMVMLYLLMLMMNQLIKFISQKINV